MKLAVMVPGVPPNKGFSYREKMGPEEKMCSIANAVDTSEATLA